MDAIVAVDEQFQIIAFNPAAEQMFGIPAERAIGETLDRFIPTRYRAIHRNHVERFAQTGSSYRRMGALGSLSAVRSNGEEFPVEASISQAVVGDGRIATVILRDVSERRANEEALLLAREVDHRAKNILAVVASLVALTPATSIEAYTQALAGRIAAMSRANALLAARRWNGASMPRLVRDELDAHAGARQIDASGPDIYLATRAAQPVGMVLHELATNSLKYGALSSPSGRISVQWSIERDGGLRLIWRESGGPPITAPAQAGFGMTLLAQIIDVQLDGSHRIDWKPGGLALEMFLPPDVLQHPARDEGHAEGEAAAPPALDAPRDEEETGEESLGTLLIVEDEPLIAMQMTKALEDFGWTVVGVAGSIESANRLLQSQSRPDVAILDVDLGGASVFPLARALRRTDIPFVFCTGFEDIGYTREFSDSPVVRKPATVLQLVAALRQVVRDRAERSRS
jgi:PAS domain S-box-containing protein